MGEQLGHESGECSVGVGVAVGKHRQEVAEVLMEGEGDHAWDEEEEYREEFQVGPKMVPRRDSFSFFPESTR